MKIYPLTSAAGSMAVPPAVPSTDWFTEGSLSRDTHKT